MNQDKVRVCLVSPFPPPYGGMAIQAQKLIMLLRENGFEVFPVKTNANYPNRLTFISKIKGLRTLVNLFLFLIKLHKALKKTETVYFLTGFFNFFFWVTYPALLLIKFQGKRVILSARGGGAEEFFCKYGMLLKPILKTVDKITTPSGFLRDIFIKTFNLKPIVIPNIADLKQFKFRERSQFRPNLLVTRSLEKIYNVGCVVQAFRKVHDHFPEAKLGIVGDGTERNDLEKLVSTLNLCDDITFYGRVDHRKIQHIYDEYDIFVNASNRDNLPGSILEAFASGLPVVSSNAGGIRYMIENGMTGLLVDNGDCHSLAEKVIQLVEDPELALKLSRNARGECQKYSWENVNSLLLPLLYTEWDHLNL